MYANCRGIKGKKDSFKEIVEKINPDIIILNETMYRNNERTNIRAYKPYTNNREGKSGGGIEILVRKTIENKTLQITEGSPGIEELTIRTETKNRTINIITLYGKIEGRESKENIKKQFSYLEEHIKRIESTGSFDLRTENTGSNSKQNHEMQRQMDQSQHEKQQRKIYSRLCNDKPKHIR